MDLTCVNKGNFKNLTEGKVYQGEEEGRDFYRITAVDDGTSKRYSRDYFAVGNNPPQRNRRRVVQEVPRPLVTIEEVMRNVNVSVSVEENSLVVRYPNVGVELYLHQSRISCGVAELSGVTAIEDIIDEIHDRNTHLSIEVISTALWNIIITALRATSYSFITMSMPVPVEGNDYWNPINNIPGTTSNSGVNRTGSSNIIVWTIKLT